MTEKLNPSEAQRELMIQAILDNSGFGPKSAAHIVDAQIAAANSIPEGAPVGTIARRPDGAWIANRLMGNSWDYRRLLGDEEHPGRYEADSWPVIYDPTKPEPKVYPYQEGDTTVIGPECFAVPDKRAIAWQGVWYREIPAAQQEPCCGVSEMYDCDCPPAIRVSPKPRSPRVVDRLGVDEQGSRWRDRDGDEYWFENKTWKVIESGELGSYAPDIPPSGCGPLYRGPLVTDTPMTELQAIAGEAAVFAYIESQAKACKEERRDWVAARMREQGIRGTVDGKAMGQIVGAVTVNGSKRKIGITNHAEFVAYAVQHHADALRLPYQYERALLDKLTDHDGTFIDRAGTVVPGVDWVETAGSSSASANKDTCPILVRGMLSNGRVSLDLKAVES